LREEALLVFLVEEFFAEELFAELFLAGGWLADCSDAWAAPEDLWAELVECLEADATAVERLPLEPLDAFDAVDDADFLAGWLAPEEVEAAIILDFV
jgi:hypothetical protein